MDLTAWQRICHRLLGGVFKKRARADKELSDNLVKASMPMMPEVYMATVFVTTIVITALGIGFVALGVAVAEKLGVTAGDGVVVATADTEVRLEVCILSRVAKNCIGYSAGYKETLALEAGSLATLSVAENWQRRQPQMIATDKVATSPVIGEGDSAHV